MPKTITLKNPIKTHAGEQRETVLRAPIAKDLVQIGHHRFPVERNKEIATSAYAKSEVAR